MSSASPFRLDGEVALVTGASRGIGAAVGLALAEAGADVVAVSRTAAADGGELGARIRALGRSCIGLAADLGDPGGVPAVLDALERLPHPVTILVNNAGIAERSPAESHSDAQWDRVLAVNLTAPFKLSRGVGRGMLERGRGRIVFMASVNSFQGGLNVISYSAAKSGLLGVMRALANEWADRGVTVNAVVPGYVETRLTLGPDGDPERVAALTPRIPVGRWARPSDVAGAVVFLASDSASYINGAVLPVDGGWLIR